MSSIVAACIPIHNVPGLEHRAVFVAFLSFPIFMIIYYKGIVLHKERALSFKKKGGYDIPRLNENVFVYKGISNVAYIFFLNPQ